MHLVIWAPLGQRLLRGALVMVAALAAAAWVLVPLAIESRWTALNEALAGTPLAQGYGARKELLWLVAGGIFDNARFPVISIAFACGAVVALRRRGALLAILGFFVASLLLSFGPASFGPLADLIPGHTDLFFRRFLMGALAGLYLAGAGVIAVGEASIKPLKRIWLWVTLGEGTGARAFTASALCFSAALLAWPAVSQVAAFDAHDAAAISAERDGEASDNSFIAPLLKYVKTHGGGRTYAVAPGNWGTGFRVGEVPVFKYLESQDIDEVGYTLRTESLMTAPEAHFDWRDPSDYVLFGVHYLLLPAGMAPPVPARLLAGEGPYTLWATPDGYVDILRVTGALSANRSDVGRQTEWLLRSELTSRHQDWAVRWAGEPSGVADIAHVAVKGAAAAASPGRVVSVSTDLRDGQLTTDVVLKAPACALISVSYDPGWEARVNGRPARTLMLAPAVLGVEVPAGAHRVTITYAGPPDRWWWAAGGILVIAGIALLGWHQGRRDLALGAL